MSNVLKQTAVLLSASAPETSQEDYSLLLDSYGLFYQTIPPYLLVGEITRKQGWILHVSIIYSQSHIAIRHLISLLIARKVPFKIPIIDTVTGDLLNARLGYKRLGKIITVYPESDQQAIDLAAELVTATSRYQGPAVPTDVYLGGTVYTRYGSFHSATGGQKENYYYSIKGQLVTDDQQVPFQLPKGVPWPFDGIKKYIPEKKRSFLHGKYVPLIILKADMKGSVRKAIKVGKWWRLQLDECVLKEGKQSMAADQWGRTIYDRLHWQYQLHQLLQGTGMIPEVYDFFTANGSAHLALQYIEGPKLQQRVFAIYSGQPWFDLPVEKKMSLLNYLEQVINVVVTCHDKGIIHRDLNPDNFLVDKTNQLWCIDFELAYSEQLQQPSPAFGVGTIGYMSPEQQRQDIPTIKEDIYALGALMITILTGLPTRPAYLTACIFSFGIPLSAD
jgi:hypothetical protein